MENKKVWSGIIEFPQSKSKEECVRQTKHGSDFMFFTLKTNTGYYDFVTFNKNLVSALEKGDTIIPKEFYPTQKSYLNNDGRKVWKISFALESCTIVDNVDFSDNANQREVVEETNDKVVSVQESMEEYEEKLERAMNRNKEIKEGI